MQLKKKTEFPYIFAENQKSIWKNGGTTMKSIFSTEVPITQEHLPH